jgi:hypothetical protein
MPACGFCAGLCPYLYRIATLMPRETLSPERAHDLEKALSAPKEIVADQATARRLDELCCVMTDTCGQIEAVLQLAIGEKSEKQPAYIRTALNLSARGTKAIKMFLSEWGVLVEESKSRKNSGRSAKDSTRDPNLALILDSIQSGNFEKRENRRFGDRQP